MKSIYDVFGTDKGLEQEGITLDFGFSRFKVRRAGGSNRKFAAALTNRTKPFQQAARMNALSPEQSNEILMGVYFDAVVLGWENVTDRSGTPLEFTFDNFKQVMTDLPDLWSTIRDECDKMQNFQSDADKEDGEHLGKP